MTAGGCCRAMRMPDVNAAARSSARRREYLAAAARSELRVLGRSTRAPWRHCTLKMRAAVAAHAALAWTCHCQGIA